jgi:hypothetical protein
MACTTARAIGWAWALAALLAAAPAVAQDDAAGRALEAEIERARAEEQAEAADLRKAAREAEAAALRAAPVPVEPTALAPASVGPEALPSAPEALLPEGPTPWERELEAARLRGHQIGAAWNEAWQELADDEEFRETGCFPSQAALDGIEGDRIRHRRLAREDFRARRRSPDLHLAVKMENAVTEAHVATTIVCVGRLRAEEVTRGRFAVWFEDLEYVALLNREESWWNPKARTNPEWVLRHEQLHFDLTEMVARRHNAERERHALASKTAADSPPAAMRAFAKRWSAAQRARLDAWEALQDQYDRETRHGTLPKQQTAWFARIHREMATLSASAR